MDAEQAKALKELERIAARMGELATENTDAALLVVLEIATALKKKKHPLGCVIGVALAAERTGDIDELHGIAHIFDITNGISEKVRMIAGTIQASEPPETFNN